MAPANFASFWPWKVDNFHGGVYSAVFMALGIGTFLLARGGAPSEFLTLGLSQSVLALFSIAGLIIVDASVHKVNWSGTGT